MYTKHGVILLLQDYTRDIADEILGGSKKKVAPAGGPQPNDIVVVVSVICTNIIIMIVSTLTSVLKMRRLLVTMETNFCLLTLDL